MLKQQRNEFESHKEMLQYFCRICREIAPGDTLINKEKFKKLGWKSKTSEDVEYVLQKQYKTLVEMTTSWYILTKYAENAICI